MSLPWKALFSAYGACLCFLAGVELDKNENFVFASFTVGVVFICFASITPEPKDE